MRQMVPMSIASPLVKEFDHAFHGHLYKAFTSVPGKPCCEIIRMADEGEGVRVGSWDPNGPM